MSVRLPKAQTRFLKSAIQNIIKDADVYIFGSRADQSKKGGDIDVLVLADRKLKLAEKILVQVEFFKQFGEQKMDLLSYTRAEDNSFKKLILSDAVKI
jgi:predicted nucleotidyltransferase